MFRAREGAGRVKDLDVGQETLPDYHTRNYLT